MIRPFTLALTLLAGTAGGKVTFDEHVLPIFEQSCLNCHNPDKAKGGLDLSTYQGTLKGGSGGKIAEPGDTSSKLLAVVMRTAEPIMPPEGDAIPKDRIETLRGWIEGGLLQNAGSKARKPSGPKFDTALRTAPGARPDGPPPMPRDLPLEPAVVAERPSAIPAMLASPTAPLLAVTAPFQVLLFDTREFELAGVLPFPEGDPVSLAITPDGRHLIVGGGRPGKSGLTATFDLITGERVLTLAREFDTVLASDLRPDLGAVATGSPSRLVKLWNPADGSQILSIKKHTDWVTSLDYSPDGILLATGDRTGGVWVWEALAGAEFHTLRAHQAAITAAAFRSDSNLLATASEDGGVRFWEMNGGREVRKLDAHPGGVTAFAWAPDGTFATAGRDRSVKLWKADFSPRRTLDKLPELPTAVALDATHVFLADYSGHIHIHRIDDGERVATLDNNPPSIAIRRQRIESELLALPAGDAEARDRLMRQRHRWYRAAVNLAATRLREDATRHSGKAGEAAHAFRQAARDVEDIRSRLAARRSERARFLELPMPDDSAALEERDSVLELLDARIAALLGDLEESAALIEARRAEPDRLFPETDALLREAARLSDLYRAGSDPALESNERLGNRQKAKDAKGE